MKNKKLYLETSVWNFLFANDAPDKRIITENFFKEASSGNYDIYISETVLFEIGNAGTAKRDILLSAIRKHSPAILQRDSDVDSLADSYISNGLLGKKHYRDILHLAFSSVNGIQILS